ncbi:Uncharacterized membrane protein YphA, DoxX/SURF4 family [Robiginitalea myxolifaciens]|uniref:Uncharacterized membrane protein YphA, DoxX/SURF4 family n=1 Tax=Robiginitalea myxolifaciens TaxID=400055 RepID=A0A1I6HDW5_9FLAO|nr:BT_3928 family protein [Robiginitalea myxolifaciens]SFR52649.1 Uncharacterized membrane protein YphA, DoxX/SURF4 family [Robiginitalea myxolifaciens]
MKLLITNLSRIVVGVLFIISGFIKLNDPVGFSFKLEEYFSEPVLNLPWLEPHALGIALFVVILEVLLGVALLVGFRLKLTRWILLGMIVFFTFLTLYSAVTGKVTDCGCFGDALKLTPWQSFYKDVALLVLILILFWGKDLLKPLGGKTFRSGITAAALVACVGFAYHVLNHLPAIDFRAYHIGTNIPEDKSVPEDAPKPVIEYDWKFRIDGEEKIITTLGAFPEVQGEFIEVAETREIEPGYEPPIHDFTLERGDTDYADALLARKNLLMIISYDLDRSHREAFASLARIADSATSLGYSVIGMSASSQAQVDAIKEEYNLNIPFYFSDQTTLKTIVRSNPGVVRLEAGTIVQKLHYNDLDQLQLRELTEAERYDLPLKKALDSVLVLDQKYRSTGNFGDWGKQMQIDSSNIHFVDSLIAERGYPGKSLVGDKAGVAAWYVIQHSTRIDNFLPAIKEAAETGELPYRLYAMMLDRSLMDRGLHQRYGTQAMSFGIGSPQEINVIWPIEDLEGVDERRKAAGFEQTLEEQVKGMFGEAYELKYYTLEEAQEMRDLLMGGTK